MKTILITLTTVLLALASCKPGKTETKAAPPAPAAGPTAAETAAAIPYPLETCLVSGEKLGGMGKPYEIIYKGRQIKFCCKNCLPDFKEDPAKYLAKLK